MGFVLILARDAKGNWDHGQIVPSENNTVWEFLFGKLFCKNFK